MDYAFSILLASGEAPEGTGNWLTILGFLLGFVIAIMQIIALSRGTKIQQPLEVSSPPKYATADAFSRHCSKQDADIHGIRATEELNSRKLVEDIHQLGIQVAEIAGHTETNKSDMKRIEARFDRLELKLDSLLARTK